jgi:hypothetical protein
MNCQDVQGRLSDYLDLSLSPAQLADLEDHMDCCPSCREEAQLLKQTIQQIHALPLVETPLGFSQRVMSLIRELETQPGFWQRVLLALNPKTAGPALALASVAAVGIYLVQKEPGAPVVATAPQESATVESAPTALPDSVPARLELADAKAVSPSQPDEPAAVKQGERPQAAEKSDPVAKRGRDRGIGSMPVLRSRPADITVRATPVGAGSQIATVPLTPPSGSAPSPTEADLPNFRQPPSSIEPFADLEIIVRRHPVSELPRAAGSESLSPRPIERLSAAIPDHTRPQTIWVRIPNAQFQEFKRELSHLGIIESEFQVPMLREQSADDGHIRVKLTAVPSANLPPTNPPEQR